MSNGNQKIEKFLSEILEQCVKSLNLNNYEKHLNVDYIKGNGFLSDFFRTTILNKENGENISIGIKIPPSGSDGADYESVFTYEVYFYSSLFPRLDAFQKQQGAEKPFDNIPRYLAGSVQPGQEFVAMEDLISAGFKSRDPKKYLDKKHLEFIFKTYGKFHALSFVFKEKHPDCYSKMMEKIANPMEKFPDLDVTVKAMQTSAWSAIESLDPATDTKQIEIFKKYHKPVGKILFENYYGEYSCLRHGDCWSNNMMFKYKDTEELIDIKLLDFQVICPGTPVHDLSYFFYTGASKEDMDILDYYLEVYYESFSNFTRELGGDPNVLYPFEVLKKEWKQYGSYGINLGFHLWVMKLMDKKEIVELMEENSLPPEQHFLLWEEKYENIRRGIDFKQKARALCLHAVEYGLIY